jgi:hypothetical protein
MVRSKREHRAQERPASEGGRSAPEQTRRARLQVRLPGFVKDEEIGLGDAIKRASYSVGIRPCGGCGQRAAVLNRWMVFKR